MKTSKVIPEEKLLMLGGDKNAKFGDITDPKYVGPGIWDLIHKISMDASDSSRETQFVKFMNNVCQNLSCKKCNLHCTEYITKNPMDEYLGKFVKVKKGNKKPPGLFVWGWKFHNSVNSKLNKPIMTWDTAYNMYSGETSLSCSSQCLGEDF